METILLWRSELLTNFFMPFSVFGSKTFYMLVLPIGYWCWQRKLFSHLIQMLCWGTIVNLLLKSIWQAPRPTIPHLVDVMESYSFPSGDIQVATVVLGALAWHFKNFWLTTAVIFLIAGVGCSRVYFGAHYPIDVLCGFVAGLLMVALYAWMTTQALELPVAVPLTALLILSFVEPILMPEATKSLCIGPTACLLGFILGEQWGQQKYHNHQIQNNNYAIILLTMAVGILGLFAIRVSLKSFANILIGESLLFTYMRYFIIGLYISFGAFWLFQRLPQNGLIKKMRP